MGEGGKACAEEQGLRRVLDMGLEACEKLGKGGRAVSHTHTYIKICTIYVMYTFYIFMGKNAHFYPRSSFFFKKWSTLTHMHKDTLYFIFFTFSYIQVHMLGTLGVRGLRRADHCASLSAAYLHTQLTILERSQALRPPMNPEVSARRTLRACVRAGLYDRALPLADLVRPINNSRSVVSLS